MHRIDPSPSGKRGAHDINEYDRKTSECDIQYYSWIGVSIPGLYYDINLPKIIKFSTLVHFLPHPHASAIIRLCTGHVPGVTGTTISPEQANPVI